MSKTDANRAVRDIREIMDSNVSNEMKLKLIKQIIEEANPSVLDEFTTGLVSMFK